MTGRRFFYSTCLSSPLFSSHINHPVSRITLQECGDHYDVGMSKKKTSKRNGFSIFGTCWEVCRPFRTSLASFLNGTLVFYQREVQQCSLKWLIDPRRATWTRYLHPGGVNCNIQVQYYIFM